MRVNIGPFPNSDEDRNIEVHIDNYDVWNLDQTLAYIIVPALKLLKDTKHGFGLVDDSDVPEELKSTSDPMKKTDEGVDENWFKRGDYVLDEMIWAFSQHVDPDWTSQYYSGETDFEFEEVDNSSLFELKVGPNHSFQVDREGIKKHQERIDNGLRLFAKYYNNLWD